jgi:hypothetical protein
LDTKATVREEQEGERERETLTREVSSPTGITRLPCHKSKINQTHLIMTEGRKVLGK